MFEAKEAARNAAGSVPWASLMGEEREDGQQQEPTGECDDWGLYHQTTDGPGAPPSPSPSPYFVYEYIDSFVVTL